MSSSSKTVITKTINETPEGSLAPGSDLNLTPSQIVSELDRYIIGQNQAKRAVAIALRSRWRRLMAPEDIADEKTPKNILMCGPTGCGKTEIARRLAKLTNSPFVRVEASTYTEVGYVGRDVESIIRDLLDVSISMVTKELREKVKEAAETAAEEKLLSLLLPGQAPAKAGEAATAPAAKPQENTREKLRRMLKDGKLDKAMVELDVEAKPQLPLIFGGTNYDEMEKSVSDAFSSLLPKRTTKRMVSAHEALKILQAREQDRLIDQQQVMDEAQWRCERHGIVFIDEIDKVTGRSTSDNVDASGEGVQRDLLPIVEGTVVPNRRGTSIRTDHILFICAGAFHGSSPSDLMPEFQGRFPIRVELSPLSKDDFVRILTEPTNSLICQYTALLATEGVELDFTAPAIEELASIAHSVNETNENIGARRLYTIMERLLEEVSFEASEIAPSKVVITPEYVRERLENIVKSEDLRKFIL
jgi:ATP-dependent HslUV protease ATP-binding subunit HslU